MSDLKKTREQSLSDLSNVSEAELHATQPNIKDSWTELQAVKRKIMEAKQKAAKDVDAQFADELKAAEEAYAFVLYLTR